MKNYVLNDIQMLKLYSILFNIFLSLKFSSIFSDAVWIGNFVESKQNTFADDDDTFEMSPSNKK